MPRPVPQPPRYCLTFTAAGLGPELAAVIAAIHLEEDGDWARTKAVVLECNALQAHADLAVHSLGNLMVHSSRLSASIEIACPTALAR
ncbi:MAG: hypothetical protein ACKOZW_13880 [Cyanobium sp.]